MEENNRNSTPIEEIESSIGSLSLDRSGSNYEENRDQSTIIEDVQFWHEDPIEDNLDPNFGNEGDGPPPYPGNAQGNVQGANAQNGQQDNFIRMIQGIILAQQNQVEANIRLHEAHQAQIEANQRFQEAHNALGNDIRNLAQVVENMNQNMAHGGRGQPGVGTFKPSMFRPLDMKQVNKENKLLSEEFMNWQMNIYRVLKANPSAANLPIQRLTALILAGIGDKAERRLTGLGQNPNFNSLEEFFEKMKSIFCSSTVVTDAEEQFNKAKQKSDEDINSWHARCQLYYRLAFPTQEYWNLLLKKYVTGMLDRKLARKTFERISIRPGGWNALCNEEGYEAVLRLTLDCQALTGFESQLFEEKTSSFRFYEKSGSASVPMDTSSVQNRTPYRGQRNVRNTTAYVHSQNKGPREPRPTPNPPAGAQKKLQQQARANRSQSQSLDKSKDRCLKCNNVGHWARDCPERSKGSVNLTQMTVVPEKHNWSDANIISPVNSNNSSRTTEQYDFSRAKCMWPTVTEANSNSKYLQLRPQSKL